MAPGRVVDGALDLVPGGNYVEVAIEVRCSTPVGNRMRNEGRDGSPHWTSGSKLRCEPAIPATKSSLSIVVSATE